MSGPLHRSSALCCRCSGASTTYTGTSSSTGGALGRWGGWDLRHWCWVSTWGSVATSTDCWLQRVTACGPGWEQEQTQLGAAGPLGARPALRGADAVSPVKAPRTTPWSCSHTREAGPGGRKGGTSRAQSRAVPIAAPCAGWQSVPPWGPELRPGPALPPKGAECVGAPAATRLCCLLLVFRKSPQEGACGTASECCWDGDEQTTLWSPLPGDPDTPFLS